MTSLLPEFWVSCDPGDSHVGWCEWRYADVTACREYTPESALERLEELIAVKQIDLLICERFSLYGWAAAQQTGSEFKTAQLIGALKYVCRRAGVPVRMQQASEGKSIYRIEPYKSWKQRDWPSFGHGMHSRDAFAHGAFFTRQAIRGRVAVTWRQASA